MENSGPLNYDKILDGFLTNGHIFEHNVNHLKHFNSRLYKSCVRPYINNQQIFLTRRHRLDFLPFDRHVPGALCAAVEEESVYIKQYITAPNVMTLYIGV